ncbi:hypothetical protein IMG5_005760, partial [Ichthyophthirius multifiliis]
QRSSSSLFKQETIQFIKVFILKYSFYFSQLIILVQIIFYSSYSSSSQSNKNSLALDLLKFIYVVYIVLGVSYYNSSSFSYEFINEFWREQLFIINCYQVNYG